MPTYISPAIIARPTFVVLLALMCCAALPAFASEGTPPKEKVKSPVIDQKSPKGDHRSRSSGRAFLFISNSIPEAQLLLLAKDATANNLPLVLRGLSGTSLQSTIEKMLPIAKIATIEIDPLLYEAYNVEVVPAVVWTCGDRGGDGPFAIIYGLGPAAALPRLQKQLLCEEHHASR